MKLQNHLKVKIAAFLLLVVLLSQVLMKKSKVIEIFPDEFPLEDINKELASMMQTRSANPEKAEIAVKKSGLLLKNIKTKKYSNLKRDTATKDIPGIAVKFVPELDGHKVSENRLKLLEDAKKHLGLKYRYGGTTDKGFDCSGFTSYVMSQSGIDISRSSKHQSKQGLLTDIKSCQTGDLVFFSKYGKEGKITHVAMVVDNNETGIWVIHSTNRGVVIDNLSESSYWKPKVLYVKDFVSRV